VESADAVVDWLGTFIEEFLICMHGCGTRDVAALRALTLES
jgi:isopentenyl-diphosphate Delta-isomerase